MKFTVKHAIKESSFGRKCAVGLVLQLRALVVLARVK